MTADPLFLPHAPSQAERARLTIFVSIVSYRDPQTLPTLHSLYSHADHPARVHTGIVWQYSPEADRHLFLSSSSAVIPASNVRQLFLHHTAARGPMHARHLCERLCGGEDCYLQLDSHMRFTQHWDTLLLDALYAAAFLPSSPDSPPPSAPRRCLITGYPSDYDVDSPALAPASPALSVMTASHFASDGLLRIKARPLLPSSAPSPSSASPLSLIPSYFIAAGFLFTSAVFLRLLPTPSHSDFPSLFFGEELLLSLRAFSFGFDAYHPPVAVCSHCWSRQYRPSWREVRKHQGEEDEGEGARRVVRLMTGEDAGERWLGSERTREQYWHWLGIDWEKQLISERGKRGGVEAERLQAADGSATVNAELLQRILAFVNR